MFVCSTLSSTANSAAKELGGGEIKLKYKLKKKTKTNKQNDQSNKKTPHMIMKQL